MNSDNHTLIIEHQSTCNESPPNMNFEKYASFWLVLVNIKAKEGFVFTALIDSDGSPENIEYKGAWANIIVQSKSINDALEIVRLGLDELGFQIVFIDKIENMSALIEHEVISDDVKAEVDWLFESEFIFKISNKLFPYE